MKISAGQISSANASVKQYITTDRKTICFVIKANMTRRMTRRKADFKSVISNFDPGLFLEKDQFAFIIFKWQLPHFAAGRCKVQHLFFFFMNVQRQTPCIMNEFIPENMIQVAMCIE